VEGEGGEGDERACEGCEAWESGESGHPVGVYAVRWWCGRGGVDGGEGGGCWDEEIQKEKK